MKTEVYRRSHACGDEPVVLIVENISTESFPRMWDEPIPEADIKIKQMSFPRMWGEPIEELNNIPEDILLHVCRDEPSSDTNLANTSLVVPAYVGMSLEKTLTIRQLKSCSHACGDEPEQIQQMDALLKSFPRMWG